MNNNELYLQYRQAIQLIRIGRHEESFQILTEIDAERPETKNVLYALAVCCEMLGRTDEAVDLCERLIARYDHPKARLIKARIQKAASASGLSAPSPPAPPQPAAKEEEIPLAIPVAPGASKDSVVKRSWFSGLGRQS